MSKHHPTIGGATRPPKIKPPQAGDFLLICPACEAKYPTQLHVGSIELYKGCDCGTLIHVKGFYDGYKFEQYSASWEVTK